MSWSTLLACLGFVLTAWAVMSGATSELDRQLLLTLRTAADPADPLGPPWFEEAAAELTALGGYTILIVITFIVTTTLVVLGKRSAAVFLLVAIGSGSAVSTAAKLAFARPRPDLVGHLDRVFTASFPSGHAMISMIAWLTLAAVAVRFVPRHGLRVFLLASAIVLSVTIGVSRVYLGVHWPSDVLAGWFLGAAWAGGCWLLAHALTKDPHEVGPLGHSDA